MNCKHLFQQTSAALALGLIGLASAPAALAADYSSNMLVQLTLVSAIDSAGNNVLGTEAFATFSNGVNPASIAQASGGAWAAYDDTGLYNNGATYLENDQNVIGSAWAGSAYSQILSNGLVHLTYTDTDSVTFNFEWSMQGAVNVNGPIYADAFASAEIVDDTFTNLIYRQMSVVTGDLDPDSLALSENGTFAVTLSGNATPVDISVLVHNNGNAVSPVPEADTYALMLAGVIVVGLLARRRKA